jgi:DNA-binding NtrC family response regulator
MTKTILVCDEDASVRRMVARVLETAGYVAILSGAGAEAVTAVRDVRPDLLLLDLNAPGPEGWGVVDQIQKRHPALPIILITGWPNLSAQAAQQGIGSLMEKPLDLPVLLDLIQQLVTEAPRPNRQQPAGEPSVEPAFAASLSLAAAARR